MGRFGRIFIAGHNNPGGIQVIIKRLAFPQEFRAENNVFRVVLFPNRGGVAHRDGGLDNHQRIGIGFQYQFNDRLHRRGIKEIFLAVIVGRSSNDDKIRIPIGALTIQCRGQVKLFFSQILFNILVLNGRLLAVNQIDFLRHNIHSHHMVVLGQQCRQGQPHISGASHSDVVAFLYRYMRRSLLLHALLIQEQIHHFKPQGLPQRLHLLDGRNIVHILHPPNHRPVDSCSSCQLRLGHPLLFPKTVNRLHKFLD